MKIDLISDIHLDMYLRQSCLTLKEGIEVFFQAMTPSKDSKVLIIAGDLGHYDHENAFFLKRCAEHYERVYFVTGNHDWYVLPDYPSKIKHARERVEKLKKALTGEDRIVFLDGTYDTFEDVVFFGFSGWYDGKYAIENFSYTEDRVNRLWYSVMNDSRMIRGVKYFKELFDEEQARLVIDKKADVVVTHVNPSISRKHQNALCMNEVSTTFYNFDGVHLVEKLAPKYWLFGHTHNPMSYTYKHSNGVDKTKMLTNPLGYPWEDTGVQGVRQITVKKTKGKKEND